MTSRRLSGRGTGAGERWGPHPLAIALVVLGAAAVLGAAIYVRAQATSDGGRDRPAVQTTKKLMWGPTALADGTSLFPAMRDLGVGIFGIQARWEMIAPKTRPEDPTDPRDPAYEWPQYLTDAIREAQKHGMQVQLMLMGTPRWANGGRSWEWKPDRASDFADFATATARRYPSVHLWMIWGEPNRAPNFQPLTPAPDATEPGDPLTPAQQVAPRNYAVMLDAAYEALKRESTRNLVIGGDTYTAAGTDNIRTYQWIDYMKLPDGSRPRMDMWGHNPWGNHRPDLSAPPSPNGTVQFSDLGRLVKALDAAGFPGKPLKLYLSEWGVPTGFEDKDLLYGLDEEDADKWIRSAFRIADWKRIYTLGWVHPTDTDRNSTGLLTEDGEEKSSYDTYKKSN